MGNEGRFTKEIMIILRKYGQNNMERKENGNSNMGATITEQAQHLRNNGGGNIRKLNENVGNSHEIMRRNHGKLWLNIFLIMRETHGK